MKVFFNKNTNEYIGFRYEHIEDGKVVHTFGSGYVYGDTIPNEVEAVESDTKTMNEILQGNIATLDNGQILITKVKNKEEILNDEIEDLKDKIKKLEKK